MRFNYLPSTIKISLYLVVLLILDSPVSAQQSVSIGSTVVKSNAVLFLNGNGQQGLIIPIVTGISTGTFGEKGMVVYNDADNKLYYHTGTGWVVAGGGSTSSEIDGIVGNEITGITNTGGLEIKGSGTAASPLTVGLIPGTANGQILKWDNTTTPPQWKLGTSGTPSFDNSSIDLNASNELEIKTLGVSSQKIADGAITNLKVAVDAIQTQNIRDGSIVGSDLANNISIATSGNLNTSGTLSVIGNTIFNTRPYTWPSTTAGSNTFLQNNGTGTLSWQPITSFKDQTAKNGVLLGDGTNISGLPSTGPLQYLRRNATNNNYEFAPLPALTAADIPALDASKITTGTFPLSRIAGDPTNSKAILGSAGGNASWVTGLPNQILGTDVTGNISFFNTANNMILKGGSPGLRPSQIIDDGNNVGIGVSNPDAKLHIRTAVGAQALKIEDGTQGVGKILVSDVNGNASWKAQLSNYFSAGSLNTLFKTANNGDSELDRYVTFTTDAVQSTIEVSLNTRAYSGIFSTAAPPATIIYFEVRLDGQVTPLSNKAAITASNSTEFISIFAVFKNVPLGPHNVSVWIKTDNGTADGVMLDPGGLGGNMIVKETY